MPAEPLKGGISRCLINGKGMMIAHIYFKKDAPLP
jgi:hypothetical protein